MENIDLYMNNIINMSRNIFSISTLGFALSYYTFTLEKNLKFKYLFQILSVLITFFAIIYGIFTIIINEKYSDKVKSKNIYILNIFKILRITYIIILIIFLYFLLKNFFL